MSIFRRATFAVALVTCAVPGFAGNLSFTDSDSCSPRVPDPGRDNFCQDAYDTGIVLNGGNYILALTGSPNTPNGNLSDGFFYDGADNQSFNDGFVGAFGLPENGNWAVDILGVTSGSEDLAAEEPNSALLAAVAIVLVGIGLLRPRPKTRR